MSEHAEAVAAERKRCSQIIIWAFRGGLPALREAATYITLGKSAAEFKAKVVPHVREDQ